MVGQFILMRDIVIGVRDVNTDSFCFIDHIGHIALIFRHWSMIVHQERTDEKCRDDQYEQIY